MKKLSELIKEHVIEKVDHKNLNLDVDFMNGKMGSCENLVIEFWKILEPLINKNENASLYKIFLRETENNTVEYYGPKAIQGK